jgi:hypothetical protein
MIFEVGHLGKFESPKPLTTGLTDLKRTGFSVREFSGLNAIGSALAVNIKEPSTRGLYVTAVA